MPKSRAKRKSPPPKHMPSELPKPAKLPKTSPDVPLTAVLDPTPNVSPNVLPTPLQVQAQAVSEKRLTFFLPDALFVKLGRLSGHARITNADLAERGTIEETGVFPDSPSAICREAIVYFLDTVVAPAGTTAAAVVAAEREKAAFWEKRIAALRRCVSGGRLIAVVLCIAALFMCSCNRSEDAPRTVNVGRFDVEDCGYLNHYSSRRVYVLTAVHGGKYLGEVMAATREEAEKLARPIIVENGWVNLCHQCESECENADIVGIDISSDDDVQPMSEYELVHSAAPALLAVCRTVEAALTAGFEDRETADELLQRVRVAIAWATGKAVTNG